ncbi:MAG: hypothetical protein MZV63_58195 [Marinilabiliales bacterium]|nr:hypothetical protein [Marinilabiliales bacterium]
MARGILYMIRGLVATVCMVKGLKDIERFVRVIQGIITRNIVPTAHLLRNPGIFFSLCERFFQAIR